MVDDARPELVEKEGWTELLPSCGGSVLITSRLCIAGDWITDSKTVSCFQSEDSVALIRNILKRSSKKIHHAEKYIVELAETLGHLPLALCHAAFFIRQQGIPIENYLEKLSRSRAVLQQKVAGFDGSKNVSAAIFQYVLQR